MNKESFYREGACNLRFFVECVREMRTITIAQGVVIITAAAYLNEKGLFSLSIIVGVFGLLFTLVLSVYHRKYMKLADAATEYLQRLEAEFSAPEPPDGPFLAVERSRMSVRRQKLDRFLLDHGTSSLILVTLLGILAYDTYDYYRILQPDASESPNKGAAANRSGLSQLVLPTTPPPSPLPPPAPTPAAAAPARSGR